MKISDMLSNNPEEQILWDQSKYEQADVKSAALSGWLAFALASVFLNALIFFTMLAVRGLEALFSMYTLLLPLLLFPLWKWIYDIHKAKKTVLHTRYTVTQKGVYIQRGEKDREQTEYISLEKIKKAYATRTYDNAGRSVGNVTVRCCREFMFQRYTADVKELTLFHDIPNYNEVCEIINEYAERRRSEIEELKEKSGGVVEAERFREPTPLEQRLKYPLKRRAESLGEAAEKEPDAAHEKEAFSAEEKKPKKSRRKKDPAVLEGDPQEAFFGSTPQIPAFPGMQRSFLNPDAAAETAWLKTAEDETIRELQQELFGSEAMQTHAFPDPTVNPLPELSESTNGNDDAQLMQRM